MSRRHPTTQVIYSTDQRWLEEMQHEAEQYRGLSTSLTRGQLIINLIDSEKYWRKQNKRKRKVEEYDEQYGEQYP